MTQPNIARRNSNGDPSIRVSANKSKLPQLMVIKRSRDVRMEASVARIQLLQPRVRARDKHDIARQRRAVKHIFTLSVWCSKQEAALTESKGKNNEIISLNRIDAGNKGRRAS